MFSINFVQINQLNHLGVGKIAVRRSVFLTIWHSILYECRIDKDALLQTVFFGNITHCAAILVTVMTGESLSSTNLSKVEFNQPVTKGYMFGFFFLSHSQG